MTIQSTAHPDTSGSSLHVVVHTRQARMLLQGRSKGCSRYIPGLQKFAGQAWSARRMSARDDPFADYALVQVEAGYQEVVKRLRETRIRHSDRWRQICSGPAVSTIPAVRFRAVSMQIRFTTYAGMALALIQQVDAVVRMRRQ